MKYIYKYCLYLLCFLNNCRWSDYKKSDNIDKEVNFILVGKKDWTDLQICDNGLMVAYTKKDKGLYKLCIKYLKLGIKTNWKFNH